jgi:hypothetical protein
MNDQALLGIVRRADPLPALPGEPPRALLERVLASPRVVEKPRLLGGRHTKLALVAAVVALGAAGTSLAIAGTSWLVGSPAPPDVKADYGSYATQLGFDPESGQAVLVASDGDYQLYATTNKQGGICTLVSAPWKRPGPNGEGGDCSAQAPDASPFWAGIGGMAGAPNATTLVLDGHTTDKGAATVQFDAPDGQSVNAPIGPSGFFIVDATVRGSLCDWGAWAPAFTVLGSDGQTLSKTRVTILPGPRKVNTAKRGEACIAMANGPFGASPGQLPPGR